MNDLKKKGTIRKWIEEGSWGIVNSYTNGVSAPQRYFVHASRVTSGGHPTLGCQILFKEGSPRNPSELPTALEIEVLPARFTQSAPSAEVR
jgi:hypothetical protein